MEFRPCWEPWSASHGWKQLLHLEGLASFVRSSELLTSGKLNSYLADIDKQAEDMLFRLVKQMAEREGVTEQLKAVNQMEWVARMNNIRNRAKEVVNTDIVFA